MPRFSPKLENLEQRRVMDADSAECMLPEVMAAEEFSAALFRVDDESGAVDGIEETGDEDWFEITSNDDLIYQTLGPSLEAAHLSFAVPPTRVFRSGENVIAIANSDNFGQQKLWGIREGGEAGGEIAFEVELGQIWVEKVLIDGDRLLLIGEEPWQLPPIDMLRPDMLRPVGGRPDGGRPVPAAYEGGKKMIAVDLASGEIVKEFELPPGFVQHADFANGQATIVLQRTDLMVPMIWPPVETSANVYRLTWDAESIGELQDNEIPSGTVAVSGDRILVAVTIYSVDTEARFDRNELKEIRYFKLTADGIEPQGTLSIGEGDIQSINVDEATDRAVITITKTNRSTANDPNERPNLSRATSVLLIDLRGETPVLAETIEIPHQTDSGDDQENDPEGDSKAEDAGRTIRHPAFDFFAPSLELVNQSTDYLVFQNLLDRSLAIVDLAEDLSGEERVRRVELPEGIALGHDSIQLDEDRIVFISGNSYWSRHSLAHDNDSDPLPISLPVPFPYSSENALATVSLSKGTVQVQKIGDDSWIRGIELIDAKTGRFGFESRSEEEPKRQFVFGSFDEDGVFVSEGQVEADSYFQTFHPHTDTITLATNGGIETYAYTDPTEPLYSISFADEDTPPLLANDDAIKLYSSLIEPSPEIQSDWIDLLANDQIPFFSQFRARIVELIDAPEGVNLAAGRYVWLDSRIESLDEPIAFKYRISDGIEESVAEVEISLAKVSEEQRDAIKAAVKAKAAEDFGVSIEELTVEPIVQLDDAVSLSTEPNPRDMLIALPILTGPYLSQSPSFAFRVTAQGIVAIYGSDLEANAYQITVLENEGNDDPSETLVELSLAATDDEGKPIESIAAGESFWLELRGQDLRRGAKGVFSAFTNLSLPESLTFEGTVEPGAGYLFVDANNIDSKVSPQLIEGLGVIDADGIEPAIGSNSRSLLRVRVTAVTAGDVTLVAAATEGNAEETALFGGTNAVEEKEITRTPLTIRVTEPTVTSDPADVDGDGKVRPVDALRVINMIGRHGVGTVEDIMNRMGISAPSAATSAANAAMDIQRFDVNRSGTITPLDALLVINHIGRQYRLGANAAASTETTQTSLGDNDSATMPAVDPAIEEQAAKRRRR